VRQDSETNNIIVFNTALKYKIPTEKKHKHITTYKHILKRASAEAREIYST